MFSIGISHAGAGIQGQTWPGFQRLLHCSLCVGKTQLGAPPLSSLFSPLSLFSLSRESPDCLSTWWGQGSWTPYRVAEVSQAEHPKTFAEAASPFMSWPLRSHCVTLALLLLVEGVTKAWPGSGRGYGLHFLMGSGKALEEHEGWEILLRLLLENSTCHSYLDFYGSFLALFSFKYQLKTYFLMKSYLINSLIQVSSLFLPLTT